MEINRIRIRSVHSGIFFLIGSVMFFLFVSYLLELTNTNFLLQKACRKNLETEPNLSTRCDDEKYGIEFVAEINALYMFFISITAFIFNSFVSAWSDLAGNKRKQVIVYITVGQIIQCICMCVQSYYWHLSPMLCVYSNFIGQTIFLGNVGIRIFSTMLICDFVKLENRTASLTMLLAVDLICKPSSNGISGYSLYFLGFFYTYLMCAILAVAGFICALFIQDTSKPYEKIKCSLVMDILFMKHIIESFKVVFKKKVDKPRIVISMLFFVTFLIYFSYNGNKKIILLFH